MSLRIYIYIYIVIDNGIITLSYIVKNKNEENTLVKKLFPMSPKSMMQINNIISKEKEKNNRSIKVN